MRETDRTKAKTKPTTTQERKEKGRRAKKKPNKASRQRMFDKAADCSDAESKVGLRLIGEFLFGKASTCVQMNQLDKTLLDTKFRESTLDDDVTS